MLKLDQSESVKQYFQPLEVLTDDSLYVFQTMLRVTLYGNSMPKLGSNHVYDTQHREESANKLQSTI